PPTDPRSPDFSVGFVGCIAGFTECRTDLSIQDENTMDFNGPAAFDVEAYTLNMSLDITDQLQVVSVTGYREMVEDRLLDLDGAKGNYITIERDNDFEQISQELRFEFVNDRISAIAGAYYWRSEFDQDWVTGGTFWYTLFGGVVINPALLGLCWAGAFAPIACDTGAPADDPGWQGPELTQLLYEDQITKSIALFTQVDYEIMPKLTATAGLRWTKEKKRFIGAQSYLAPVSRAYVHNHPGFADLSQTWKEISPKFSLSYQHSDDILFYASYSEGFHSGGYFGVNQNTRDFVRDQYDPEFANSWEGGMKGQFLDNRVQLNATYFYNDFKDKQEQAVVLDQDTKTVATVFSNVASAVYQGFEVDLQLVVNQYISLFATFGYLDAEYKDFMTDLNPNDDNLGQKIEDATHLRPRNAPKNTYGFGGTAVYPVGEGEIEVHAKYHFIDKIETSLVNADNGRLASRDFIDASVGYNWRSMRLTLFGRNLDDEVWETYGPIANLFAVGTRVPGRSWGIELEVEL
ncbi:MAG: TonB-dependent receptor, partial [Gammaproteobacteria bacterium]|nr:TonB-dependent receptor [Gammaproteobacteria bacterium]